MIVLFTDFGLEGPYVGQMLAVLYREAPGVPAVNLFADAPAFDSRASAYLLAAYIGVFPPGSVFLCVVDPGVGGDRAPLVVEAGGRWFVGPDNGLFEPIVRRAESARAWVIDWRPPTLSASFHGRDLFAPVAARLARGEPPPGHPVDIATIRRPEWPRDLAQVVYIDRFGNVMTGLRAEMLGQDAVLEMHGQRVTWARTFSAVPVGTPFWYENANGLVEIAVNQGDAARALEVKIGYLVGVEQ